MATGRRKSIDREKAVEGVYERSPGTWYVRYRRNGKIFRKSFGANKKEAIAYYRKVKVLIRSGEGFVPDTAKKSPMTSAELNREELLLQANGISLSELCDDFIAHVKSRPEEYRDQRNPPQRVEAVREALGRKPAASVRPFEIEQWLDELKLQKGYKPATLNRMKATISSVYQLGKQRDKVTVNPARDVKQRRVGPGIIRFLKPDEEKRLRAVLEADIRAAQERPQYQKHMIHRLCELDVALGTGMRKLSRTPLTIECVKMRVIAKDFEPDVFIGSGQVKINSPQSISFKMYGSSSDLAHSLLRHCVGDKY